MKVLVATEKPFAKQAVDGVRKIVEDAGFQLVLLENTKNRLILLKLLLMLMPSLFAVISLRVKYLKLVKTSKL